MSAARFAKKVGVGWSLIRNGEFSSFARAATSKLVRIDEQRIDRIDLSTHRLDVGPDPGAECLRCELATQDQMERLFAEWRDSQEEYDRHYRVYFDLGFRRCFLCFDDSTNRVAHFQFLLDYGDRELIKKRLPWPVYRRYIAPDAAWQEWVYTFSDYRRKGVSLVATAHVAEYCRDHGINVLYSRRGAANRASVGMADRIGYVRIAIVYHVQTLRQSGTEGYYFIRSAI